MAEQSIFDSISSLYQGGETRAEIARQVGISQITVKKILISLDLFETEKSRRIVPLIKSGMSQKRIAAHLGLSRSCVNSNSPYVRSSYLIPSQTDNARKIRQTRAKGVITLTCRICGKPYKGENNGSTVCSDCVAAARKTTIRFRVCRECGQTFPGGPRAWYCPECRAKRKKEQKHRYQTAGPVRPIGSTDTCVVCGKPYTVDSGRQKYCPDCAEAAVKAVVRPRKRKYNRVVWNPRRKLIFSRIKPKE